MEAVSTIPFKDFFDSRSRDYIVLKMNEKYCCNFIAGKNGLNLYENSEVVSVWKQNNPKFALAEEEEVTFDRARDIAKTRPIKQDVLWLYRKDGIEEVSLD